MSLTIDGKIIATDKEGYIKSLEEWSEKVAEMIAIEEKIKLTSSHWEVVLLLRQFYQEFELSPTMRSLVKYIANNLGKDKGNSIYLLKLFPPNPAKIASKIAGLPRPKNCL
ncbi:sulfurtransferase TusE [Candidatus Endobugula sertula]|uniref:Sulfurtransferase n=1 Tax=Candidatus Endobugula sertula TaxID=62101 RepID=A0A1D2QT31_9GAMM|nr:sulfurtransferase TusE [Candidatus Endobugula sertula]